MGQNSSGTVVVNREPSTELDRLTIVRSPVVVGLSVTQKRVVYHLPSRPPWELSCPIGVLPSQREPDWGTMGHDKSLGVAQRASWFAKLKRACSGHDSASLRPNMVWTG